jgi:hypothetical protein
MSNYTFIVSTAVISIVTAALTSNVAGSPERNVAAAKLVSRYGNQMKPAAVYHI